MGQQQSYEALGQIADTYKEYGNLNPLFDISKGELQDPRAIHEINQIFEKKSGNKEKLPCDKEIALQIENFHIRMLTKVAQMQSNEVWKDKGPASLKDFKSSPRTFLKTLQEILSGETELIYFHLAEIIDPKDEAKAIKSIIVDPARITPTLLTNLGGEHLIIEDEDKDLVIENKAQAIEFIQDMISNLEPLKFPGEKNKPRSKHKNFRYMRVSKGLNQGYLLGTRNLPNGKKILFKTDLFNAEKRIINIKDQYQEENKELNSIALEFETLQNILQLNKQKDLQPNIRTSAANLIKISESLKNVLDEHKVLLRSEVAQTLSILSNPENYSDDLLEESLNLALKYIRDRMKGIQKKSGYLEEDLVEISRITDKQYKPIDKFNKLVEDLHSQFKILNPETPLNEYDKNKIRNQLTIKKAEFIVINLQPFSSFKDKIIDQIDILIKILDKNDYKHNSREFIKLYLISKMARAAFEINNLYKKISNDPKQLDPLELLEEITQMKNRFADRPVSPEVVIEDFKEEYDEVYHLFNSLRKRLIELTQEPPVRPSPQRLRDMIKDVVFATINKQTQNITSFLTTLDCGLEKLIKDVQTPTPKKRNFTTTEKLEKIELMKTRIKEFDFISLASKLNVSNY